MILNTAIETMNRTEMQALQSQRMQKTVERCYKKVSFYQHQMDALNVKYTDIKTINDINRLPFTTAHDLSANYPFGLVTMPISGVARFEQTPDLCKAAGFTAQDLAWQKEMIARSLIACDITAASVLLELTNPFPGNASLSLRQTAEILGITVIASQNTNATSSLKTIEDFGVTTIFSSPDNLFAFADFLQKQNVEIQDLPLKSLLCEANLCHNELRCQLQQIFKIPVYTLYGRPDIASLGIAGDCYHQDGLHINEDHFYPEIIDPDTGEVLEDNQPGELVLTTISREATPLIRYRTQQIAVLTRESCICGRTSPRITFVSL